MDDGEYRLAARLDGSLALSASASGVSLSSAAGALRLERDGATGLYRLLSGGLALTESGRSAALAEPDGSASQLWQVSPDGSGGYRFRSSGGLALDVVNGAASDGGGVWLYEPNASPAQSWDLASANINS